MESIILGLLMGRERTLYEINKILEASISLFYSASFGSISTALGKLEAKQWVAVRETVERGRNKRLYTLTVAGAEAFSAWLGSPIPSEKVRDPALTRLFFLGHMPSEGRVALLEEHVSFLETIYATLELLERQAEDVMPLDAHRDLAIFQHLTLRYGKDYYGFSIAWFKRLLISLKEQGNDREG